jgi:hypothetical protein
MCVRVWSDLLLSASLTGAMSTHMFSVLHAVIHSHVLTNHKVTSHAFQMVSVRVGLLLRMDDILSTVQMILVPGICCICAV